jgi:hypothetical protein
MSGASSTGQFWICPKCQRHVPNSVDTCRCGIQRSSSNPVAPPHPSTPSGANAWLGWACAALLLGYLVYDKSRSSRDAAPKAAPAPPAAVVLPTPQAPVKGAQPDPSVVAAEQAAAEKAWADLGKSVTESPRTEPAIPPASAPLAVPAAVVQQPPPQQPYVPEEQTERYWKQRLFQSRDRIRTAFDACTSQYHAGGVGDYGNTQYAAVRGSLVSAISAQNQLEEEARQGGIAPGWVRFDWTPYPRMRVADPLSQTGTLTGAHPCSVPDIRESLGLR